MLEDDMLQRQRELLLEIARNKRLLIDALANRPFVQRLIAGRANFVLVRVEAAEDLLAFCAGRGVILRGFPAEPLLRGFIRISVGSADDLATLSGALDAWQETRAKRVERSA
jgi:histidinol-phosphate/aromatic aminotransferase/cobyric acid decarboxylase-like protein